MVYNGDIKTPEDVKKICDACGNALESVMIGRGFLADPSLVRQCQGGSRITKAELSAFHDELYDRFGETLPGTKVVLSHMKELWFYMGSLFEDGEKYLKEIRRAGNRAQYEAAVRVMLSVCSLKS